MIAALRGLYDVARDTALMDGCRISDVPAPRLQAAESAGLIRVHRSLVPWAEPTAAGWALARARGWVPA